MSSTCYISAPLESDTSQLRLALETNHVRWSDAASLPIGVSLQDSLFATISDVDFVCGFLPEGWERSGSLIFELGIATGLRKPILLFVAPRAEVPLSLRHLRTSVSDLKELSPILSQLEPFLEVIRSKKRPKKHVTPTPIRRFARTVGVGSLADVFHLSSGKRGQRFEDLVAQTFADAGIVVSQYRGTDARTGRPDLAVWISELSSLFGNPILVECKIGPMDERRLMNAEKQLQLCILTMGTLGGLVIYADDEGKTIVQRTLRLPFILWLSFNELVRLLEEGTLPQHLADHRNRIAHGGGDR